MKRIVVYLNSDEMNYVYSLLQGIKMFSPSSEMSKKVAAIQQQLDVDPEIKQASITISKNSHLFEKQINKIVDLQVKLIQDMAEYAINQELQSLKQNEKLLSLDEIEKEISTINKIKYARN